MAKKIKIRRASAFDCVEIVSLLLQGAAEQRESIWYPRPTQRPTKQVGAVLALIDQGVVIVAEQEVDGRLVAAIGVTICQDDWSDEWKMVNEWLYVMPDFRDTDIADQLLTFVEHFADAAVSPQTQEGLPIVMAMMAGQDTELKDELMRRRGYQYGGGNWVRAPRSPNVQVEEDDADAATGDPPLAGTG